MTEEEKKVIEYWKEKLKDYKKEIEQRQNDEFKGYGTLEDMAKLKYCNLHTMLNLIEKQQKEIEKKENKIAFYKKIYEDLQKDFDSYKNNKDINYLDRNHHKKLVEKSVGQRIDKPEECWFDIFEVKVIKNNMLYGITINEDFITLKQISDSDPDNCITVIAESPLSGAIYRYNNYGTKEWQLIGTMLGYA